MQKFKMQNCVTEIQVKRKLEKLKEEAIISWLKSLKIDKEKLEKAIDRVIEETFFRNGVTDKSDEKDLHKFSPQSIIYKAIALCDIPETSTEPKIISENSKNPEAPEAFQKSQTYIYQNDKTICEACNKSELFKVQKKSQITQTVSEVISSNKPETSEIPKECQITVPEVMNFNNSEAFEISDKKFKEDSESSSIISDASSYYIDSDTEYNDSDIEIEEEDGPEKAKSEGPRKLNDIIVWIRKKPVINSTLFMHFQLRKVWPPLRSVDLIAKPLVLATYRMAPSLPFKFFETFAEIIEDILERPVVLLHETKDNRPIPSDLVEIAIMPASENWNIGKLLPVTFEFQHALNMPKCTNMYADVVVLKHSLPRISLGRSMSSLQECKVSIAKKNYRHNSVAGLFWNYLISTGRTPQFFATVLDANNGRDVISMVIDGIADAGIVEAPVLTCNRYNLVGAEELEIFASIGPLPPYRIMIHPRAAEEYGNMLTDGLLENDSKWHKRLNCLGILGFAKNSADNYKPIDETPVVTEIFYSSEY